jgi:hypothetical protein
MWIAEHYRIYLLLSLYINVGTQSVTISFVISGFLSINYKEIFIAFKILASIACIIIVLILINLIYITLSQ